MIPNVKPICYFEFCDLSWELLLKANKYNLKFTDLLKFLFYFFLSSFFA